MLRRKLLQLLVVLLACLPQVAHARVRLEHICSVQGQQEVRLTGFGLVIGLPGTGDGAKNAPTVRALRAALTRMKYPIADGEIKNADNVAVVMVEATIPKTGLRRGQKIDCHVSAIGGAKSLRGGRLLSTPLTTAAVRSETAVGLAGGGIDLEDVIRPTVGKIAMGVDLLTDVTALFVNQQQQENPVVTLLIDPNHASFWTSSEIARVVNSEFSFESSGTEIARPVGPAAVEIRVPEQYRKSTVDFVAQILETAIDLPHTQARVVLNSKTGTVIVTGEVELSPVVISHKSFSIEIDGDAPLPGAAGPFVAMMEGSGRQSPQQFKQLVDALNQLRVPTEDIIAIIRELHATGKLHAELVER